MTAELKLKIQGSMAEYAQALVKGTTDPKTGATVVEKADIRQALQNFAARGYLSGDLQQWGVTALASAYGLSPEQIMQVAVGIDPATGGSYGATAPGTGETAYGPEQPVTDAGKTPRPGKGYLWVDGKWRKPPGPGYVWQDGEWIKKSTLAGVPGRVSGRSRP